MRLLFTLVLVSFFTLQLFAQAERSGSIWLDGNSSPDVDGGRGGYFVNDRLLIGLGVENDVSFVSPFVRYYLTEESKYRPYLELGTGFSFESRRDFFQSARAAAGVERLLAPQILLNVELAGQRFFQFDGTAFSLGANLNTFLGGPAGKNASVGRFHKGALTLQSQLLGASRSNFLGDATSFTLSPRVGYFFTDRLMGRAGLQLSLFDITYEESLNRFDFSEFSTELDLGLRYYITAERVVNFFAEGGVTAGYNDFNVPDNSTFVGDNATTVFNGYARIGGSVFVNSSVSVDGGAGYLVNFDNDDDSGLDFFLRFNFWLK